MAKNDGALSREIGLKVWAGKYDEAISLMTGRKFAVWEGGSLEVADHWVNAHLLRGRHELATSRFSAALADFTAARFVPDNLPNDREGIDANAELAYWLGMTHKALGNAAQAQQAWHEAVDRHENAKPRRGTEAEISGRHVQNYYQALAARELGQDEEARHSLLDLLQLARDALDREGTPVVAGRSVNPKAALAHYLAGLAQFGLGRQEDATREFRLAIENEPDALGAKVELEYALLGTGG